VSRRQETGARDEDAPSFLLAHPRRRSAAGMGLPIDLHELRGWVVSHSGNAASRVRGGFARLAAQIHRYLFHARQTVAAYNKAWRRFGNPHNRSFRAHL